MADLISGWQCGEWPYVYWVDEADRTALEEGLRSGWRRFRLDLSSVTDEASACAAVVNAFRLGEPAAEEASSIAALRAPLATELLAIGAGRIAVVCEGADRLVLSDMSALVSLVSLLHGMMNSVRVVRWSVLTRVDLRVFLMGSCADGHVDLSDTADQSGAVPQTPHFLRERQRGFTFVQWPYIHCLDPHSAEQAAIWLRSRGREVFTIDLSSVNDFGGLLAKVRKELPHRDGRYGEPDYPPWPETVYGTARALVDAVREKGAVIVLNGFDSLMTRSRDSALAAIAWFREPMAGYPEYSEDLPRVVVLCAGSDEGYRDMDAHRAVEGPAKKRRRRRGGAQ